MSDPQDFVKTDSPSLRDSGARRFREVFAHEPTLVNFAPGRVNLIGEHLDYNGGQVLPYSISAGTLVMLASSQTPKVRLFSDTFSDHPEIYDCVEDFVTSQRNDSSWVRYVRACLYQLIKENKIQARFNQSNNQSNCPGFDLLTASSLPIGAGLSSSASFLVALTRSFQALYPTPNSALEDLELARFCQRIENQSIGVQCGLMDPLAIAAGTINTAIKLDCASETYTRFERDFGEFSGLIIDSGISRQLANSEFNLRRQQCEQALTQLQRRKPRLKHLAHAEIADLAALAPDLKRRVKHVVSEQTRVMAVEAALKVGDIGLVGRLLNESHLSLSEDYQVSLPEIDVLMQLAQSDPACAGARIIGAGFGGCCFALVRSTQITAFQQRLKASYTGQTSRTCQFYPA